ncbi:MAG: hypothetical protein K0S76_2407 [Herbinix sp.]|jgi:uncharacterized protein YlxP (DUF503 family)|nr:hypothetical protein [Herbinix sp.]
MVVGVVKIKIHTPWVHSLKEKRMVVKSLSAKARNQFNVSIAEVEDQDLHQSVVLAFACVAGDTAHADSICDNVLNFLENNTEGDIVSIEREIL